MDQKWLGTLLIAGFIFALIVGIFLWSEGHFRDLFQIEELATPVVPPSNGAAIAQEILSPLSSGKDAVTSPLLDSEAVGILLPANAGTNYVASNIVPSEHEAQLFRRIQVSFDLQQYDSALQAATDYLSLYPNGQYRLPILYYIGHIFYNRRNFREALSWCKKAIGEGIPPSYEVSFGSLIGFILKDAERSDPALLSWMEQVYLRHPDENTSALVVGIAYQYLYKNNPKTALAYLQEAQGELALIGRARAYIAMQNYAATIQEYENFFHFYPDSPRKQGVTTAFLRQTLHYARFLARENPSLAITYYEKLWRFPNSAEAEEGYREAARLLQQQRRFNEALRTARAGLSNSSRHRDPYMQYQMAEIFYETANRPEALSHYEKFLAAHPNHPLAGQARQWIELIQKEMALQ